MDVRIAGPADLAHVAQLVWWHAAPEEQQRQRVEAFAADLGEWWRGHPAHTAFLAQQGTAPPVGVAWLALLPRVPRPGATDRLAADVQSVFVVPEARGQGVGSALVQAAVDHARHLGADRVTVHSSRRAVPVYERLGFTSSPQHLQRGAG